ncbi:hypothetical protein [Sphingomonas sp. BK345]|uniref:hypothetical protein n=1 Tax=Sphingomonas sp. BK345 TaxID=2586980 RepID=UPI00160C98DC|nr:hypothetical protein [Sphingomonas sp. BK345]MBB3475733.1 putative membrane protein YphA (DoxX/SURF4 family) [Sphingomonas sp. BK345]
MKHPFSAFPAGSAGVALLLLRASVSIQLLSQGLLRNDRDPWLALSTLLLALVITGGLLVRVAAVIAVVLSYWAICRVPDPNELRLASDVLSALALALAGPGAFSIDAWRFGRSTVTLR